VKLGKWLPQQDILGNAAFYFWQKQLCVTHKHI
jgi:hypothetical protein